MAPTPKPKVKDSELSFVTYQVRFLDPRKPATTTSTAIHGDPIDWLIDAMDKDPRIEINILNVLPVSLEQAERLATVGILTDEDLDRLTS